MTGLVAFVFHISERMAMVSGREAEAEAADASDDETDIIIYTFSGVDLYIIV